MSEWQGEVVAEAGPVVAIDGPAGSGKSTVAAAVAVELGVPHIDTGAMYRAVTLACLRAGVGLADGDACGDVAERIEVRRRDGRTFLDGDDVEEEIRGPVVTGAVSQVAAHGRVRDAMVPLQRVAADRGGVMEGRDIGTVVLPDADVKVFLTASPEERARRRAAETGDEVTAEAVEAIARRDEEDATRDHSPMVRADDAWELDTTGLEIAQVVEAIVARARAAGRAGRLPRVAVVGRPNVGKSTLVNRILGHRIAIVEEKPGVTRDRTEHAASWTGHDFLLVDTGGWEASATGMAARIVEQAERAIADADVVVFVVDVTVGVLEDDERYARLLRRTDTPVVLAANKTDSPSQEPLVHELYGVGLGTPHPISAAHGRGVGDLLDVVCGHFPEGAGVHQPDDTPRIALVGRPNVGKSSLFNRLIGEERSIVDAVAHTTRDAVDTVVTIDGRDWRFVDTAGLRRRYRHGENTELYSVDRTRMAVRSSDLALFLVDGSEPLGEQEQRLAAMLRDEGRGLLLVVNKWDQVDEERRPDLEAELDRLLHFASWAPRVNVSALTGRGTRRLVPNLTRVWTNYHRRIPTSELNAFLRDCMDDTPTPPLRSGRPLKIRFITQATSAPPRFLLFANGPVPAAYSRYLERRLRENYDFTGVPLALESR